MRTHQAERFVPDFLIRIRGKELRRGIDEDLLSVSVTDVSDRADSFTFKVWDPHAEPVHVVSRTRKWKFDGLFDEGTEVEIQMGYRDKLSLMLRGEITAVTCDFPEEGHPTLTIRGFSLYHRLQRQHRREPFEATTDSGIAREIAVVMGLNPRVDETAIEYPLVSPNDETYASILTQRAKRIGYEVVVKDDTLYFQRPRYLENHSPVITLEWGKDLRSFNSSLSTYNMVSEVTVRGSQTSQGRGKDPLVGTARGGDERIKLGEKTGPQIVKHSFGDNPILSDDHSITSQQEASEIALAKLESKALDFICGNGSCVGDPRLMARTVIELKGVGKLFSGNYYVTSATHTIDSNGYRTDFEVKRNAR
jgi:phage protein D